MKFILCGLISWVATAAFAADHPRLIFRPADLPLLRQRMATPAGQAIVARLREAPLRDVSQVNDKRVSWIAAGWGVVYQLTGDATAAATARRILMDEVVKKPMPADRTDVQLAPRLLGVALTYDLCYDAWDAEFRALMTDYLYQETVALYQGVNRGDPIPGLNRQPAAHPNAIRMSSVGCAALALLGEKTSDGQPIAEAEEMLKAAERDITRWLREGVSRTGRGVEGDFFKAFALANGVLQFLHAERLAGRDLSAVNPMLLPGHLWEMIPVASSQPQLAGRWPMGLGTAPAEWKARLNEAFDREAGKTFDCTYVYHVGYALMNDPSAVPGQLHAPGRLLADADHGHVVFRNGWQDTNDFVTVLDLRSRPQRGMVFAKTQPAARLRITGLGRTWFDGSFGFAAGNDFLGAQLLALDSVDPDRCIARFDLERLLLVDVVPAGQPARKSVAIVDDHLPAHTTPLPNRPKAGAVDVDPALLQQPDIRTFPQAPSAYRDNKVRSRRQVAVDYSRTCGAPALYVVVEQVETPPAKGAWQWELEGLTATGNRFSIGERTGPNLSGVVVAPGKINHRAGKPVMTLTGGLYFLVFTIQSGEPPDLKVEGEGWTATVQVGKQSVRFDGEKIVFGK
jgi:hypothetical protein